MTIRLLVFAATAVSSVQAPAQQPPTAAPPATEVFVASLAVEGGTFRIGPPENISKNAGYDNQPFFSPDGASVFFTSGRAVAAGSGPAQMDIYRYDFATRLAVRVTDTPESEYSPTVMPDRRHLSVVRVEADQTQRLWRFTMDGKDPALVLTDIKPVGYHAWLDESRLALFVLGQPATLQVADIRTGKAETVAQNIGPSIQKAAGGVSFVQESGDRPNRSSTIVQLTLDNAKPVTRRLIGTVPGSTHAHHAWTADGTLLMAHGGSLHAWREGDTTWRVVADLAALGLKDVTRLAISPKGDRIAMVGVE